MAYADDGYASENRSCPAHGSSAPRLLAAGRVAEPVACVIGGLDVHREHAQVALVGAGFMGGSRCATWPPSAIACSSLNRGQPPGNSRVLGADAVAHPDEVPGGMRLSAPVVTSRPTWARRRACSWPRATLASIDGTLVSLGYHQSNGGRRVIDMQGWNFRAMRVVSLHSRSPENILTWIDRAQRSAALGFDFPA